jgi:hypothetical protein
MRRMLIIFGTVYLMDISSLLVKFQPYRLNTCKMTGKLKFLTRCTYDKNLDDPAISSGALFAFSVLAPWWPSQESPRGTYVQSFSSIAPAVTKRALLTDDDDGQHVIVRAHT